MSKVYASCLLVALVAAASMASSAGYCLQSGDNLILLTGASGAKSAPFILRL